MNRKILLLEFDGNIHSYRSPYTKATIIPDPIVPGVLPFITEASKHFDVTVHSHRSHRWGGIRAMKKWLAKEYCRLSPSYEDTPDWLKNQLLGKVMTSDWDKEMEIASRDLVNKISWPIFRPVYDVAIDARTLNFTGSWDHQSFLIHNLVRFKIHRNYK